MNALSYTGEVRIDLEFLEKSRSFKIHAAENLRIVEIRDQELNVLGYSVKPHSILEVLLAGEVLGKVRITILFAAKVLKSKYGCYVCCSDEEKMVTTLFEPTYGRMALPCFDEPALKSTFDLKIEVEPGWVVISNMPSKAGVPNAFETSPLMSFYLLHFTICKQDVIRTKLNETEIALYTRSPQLSSEFLTLAKDSLDFYNTLFRIPYPLPKMDLISIFRKNYLEISVRAMENWGAIAFQESILVKRPEESFEKYFRDCRTVCHEISHMWFGNLVTMEWWTDLWLNEGFARFMEFKCLEIIRPQFDPWGKFVSEVLYTALGIDTPISRSHPVEIECLDPDNIQQYFDSISYLKGASVLRMMENVMGPSFGLGVNHYLKNYEWKNVTSDQFFDCMQSFTSIPVKAIIRTWTQQPGFPLITVKKEAHGVFRLVQRPFDSSQKALWIIPIRYITETGAEGLFMLDKEEDILEVAGSWVKLNQNSTGFYRVDYEHYEELFENVQKLSAEDRYGLLNDAIQLYDTNRVPLNYLEKLLNSLVPETSFTVCKLFYSLLDKYYDSEEIMLIEKAVKENSLALYEKFGVSQANGSLDFPAFSSLYMSILINRFSDENVIRDITKNHKSCQYYEKCLLMLPLETESFMLVKKSFIFQVLGFSNDKKLLSAALERICRDVVNLDEELEDVLEIVPDRIDALQDQDELVKVILDRLIEENNSEVSEILVKLLFKYKYCWKTGIFDEPAAELRRRIERVKGCPGKEELVRLFEELLEGLNRGIEC